MGAETSGAEPAASSPTADATEPRPNGANGKHGGDEAADAPSTTAPVDDAPIQDAPAEQPRRWRRHVLIGLLALNLLASAIAIGWIAWIVADQARWLDEVKGPPGEQGLVGEQGQQGIVGLQGEQGQTGEPGSSADADTLNRLAERLAELETDLASNDLGLEAERLSTRLEQLETQVVDLCDSLRDSFVSVSDACPAGSPAGQGSG